MPADSADLPFFRGTMTNRTRKRLRPLDLWSQPKVQQRIQICQGSSRIVSLARAHLPFECGSRSMNRQTRAAFSSSKRKGKSLRFCRLSSARNRLHCSRIDLQAGIFPLPTSRAYSCAIAAYGRASIDTST
jgi:hypothetical protein